jgi:outer membrane protein assembly factor BamB
MKTLALVVLACISTPVLAEKALELDLEGVPRLSVTLPEQTLEPNRFKRAGRGVGWVVRIPTGPRRADRRSRMSETFPSPTVAFGRVFVGGGLSSRQFFALDAATGRRIWSAALEDNGPSPCAVTPDVVVLGTESCTGYGYNTRTGAREWSRWLGPNIYAAPTLMGNKVLMAYRRKSEEEGIDAGYALTALRLKDGEPVWETDIGRDLYGAPVCALGRIYVSARSAEVRCLDEKGKTLWTSRARAECAPWLGSSGLYVTINTGEGLKVMALDPMTGRQLWLSEAIGPHPRPRTVTTESSVVRPDAPHTNGWCSDPPRPVETAAGVVLAQGPSLFVLNPASGKVRRRIRLPEGRAFFAPPALLGDLLLFATLDGMLLEIDAKNGAVRRALDLGVRLTSQPVVAKGRVHLAADGYVFGIPWAGKRDKRMPEWPQWGGGATRTGR